MHHDRLHARLFQYHHVLGEAFSQFRASHGVAAIFDDDDLLIVALHIGQSFREDRRMGLRRD
jgi:hypothetical protein